MKRPIILIGNPSAGRNAAGKIEKAAVIIKDKGFDVHLLLTEKQGDAESFARKIAEQYHAKADQQSMPLIIAAGGDGTYNEVINGIAQTSIPMAILSLGTTNVLAKELNIPDDIESAIDIALSRTACPVSLGKITLISQSVSRYFCLMAGIGYDAAAVYDINITLKKFTGKFSYILNGIKALLYWNPERLFFEINGKTIEAYSAIICNASKYAGHFRVAPDTGLTTQHLNAFLMHGRKRSDILRYAYGIMAQKHLGFKDTTYQQAGAIYIRGQAHIQIDGDYLGVSPAKVEVVPDAVRLVY